MEQERWCLQFLRFRAPSNKIRRDRGAVASIAGELDGSTLNADYHIIANTIASLLSVKTESSSIRNGVRILRRGTVALWCLAACLAEYGARALVHRLDPVQRAAVLQKWSARLLAGIKVSVAVHGLIPEQGLIVSNHLSYLDILVFAVVCPCVFVAKREIKSWPGVGWAASLAGTIYIDRTRRADTHLVQPEMQSALSRGLRLVVFPEGTSSDGSRVLHFHSSLFQPAVDLNAQITAAAIEYRVLHGDAATEACYWGNMVLLPHLLNLLTKTAVEATVNFSEQHLRFADRKEAARTMHLKVKDLREVSADVHCSSTKLREGP